MPSAKQREEFEQLIKPYLEEGKTDKEIAEIVGRPIQAVATVRRRLGSFEISPHKSRIDLEVAEPEVLIRAEEKLPRAYKVVYQGKTYWCKNEFFGIWER